MPVGVRRAFASQAQVGREKVEIRVYREDKEMDFGVVLEEKAHWIASHAIKFSRWAHCVNTDTPGGTIDATSM